MALLKNDKIMIEGVPGQLLHFLRKLQLKVTYELKISPGNDF